jgi:hypothetical protein
MNGENWLHASASAIVMMGRGDGEAAAAAPSADTCTRGTCLTGVGFVSRSRLLSLSRSEFNKPTLDPM